MRILILIFLLMVMGTHISYADTTPAEVKQTESNLDQRNDILKRKIENNDDNSRIIYNNPTINVPIGNGTYGCGVGGDGKYHCILTEYNLPVIQPGMQVVPGTSHGVPQPNQYKNVFKLIATVMYMFAAVYFLIQIAMEFFRKRYVQALALLMIYLVGSSILYVAYRMVFNAP